MAACAALVAACGGANAEGPADVPIAAPAQGPAQPYPDAPGAWGRFHSRRFRMTIPLPDIDAWQIDDHSQPDLVAKEPRTRSTLLARMEDETRFMNHDHCEARARELGLAPSGELKTIVDELVNAPAAYDTRVRVQIESAPGKLVGHVTAFGADMRRCLMVHLTTEVAGEEDEQALSDRLAMARVRTIGGLKLEMPGDIARLPEAPP